MTSLSTTESVAAGPVGALGGWAAAKDCPAVVNRQAPDENAVLLEDGRVLVAGGQGPDFVSVSTCAVFDPEVGTWTTTGPLAAARCAHSVTRLEDGTVLAAGGYPTTRVTPAGLTTAERYYPDTGKWVAAGPTPMSVERAAHSATVLADGRVLVAGGYGARGNTPSTTASAEIYDPQQQTWTPIAPMNEARSGHQGVRLRDGRVLVIGGTVDVGYGDYAGLAFCEIFDPVTEAWTPTGSTTRPRWNITATVLADGTVLVTGGGWNGWIANWVYNAHNDWTTERYNPVTGIWTRDADLSCARLYHRAVLLHDGRVLVIGGADGATISTGFRSAELYDPRTRRWQPAAGLATGRWAFGALTLADGRVLVTGGVDCLEGTAPTWRLTASTEIYTPSEGEQ